jgi:TM2 domain-containing membrane protein YozV
MPKQRLPNLQNALQVKNRPTAYALWALGLVSLCGIHRLYTGRYKSGLLYLATFGLCGIGQLLDLLFIDRLVEQANRESIALAGLSPNPSLGSSALALPLEGEALDRAILRLCRTQGEVSLADLCLELHASREQIRERLQVLMREDLLTVSNAQDGRVVYRLL